MVLQRQSRDTFLSKYKWTSAKVYSSVAETDSALTNPIVARVVQSFVCAYS